MNKYLENGGIAQKCDLIDSPIKKSVHAIGEMLNFEHVLCIFHHLSPSSNFSPQHVRVAGGLRRARGCCVADWFCHRLLGWVPVEYSRAGGR